MKPLLFSILNLFAISLFSCSSPSSGEVTEEIVVEEVIEDEPTIQKLEPIKWQYRSEKLGDNQYKLIFDATIDDTWYVYSSTVEEDGPIPTSINFDETDAIESTEDIEESGKIEKDGYDEMFDMDIKKFGKSATFSQVITVNGPTTISGYLEYMTCDSIQCLFPDPIEFTLETE